MAQMSESAAAAADRGHMFYLSLQCTSHTNIFMLIVIQADTYIHSHIM